MRAAVLTKLNTPLELLEVENSPPAVGQVRVRMIASGLCGAQLQEIRGEKGGPLPHLLGHEGCGTVEEVGPGVTRVKPGDRVVLHWRKAAGIESPFPRYSCGEKSFTSGLVTTLAEVVVVSENRVTPVPPGTDPALAALLGCGLSTALGTIEQESGLRWGEAVLVVGCGGLGANLIQAALLGNAGRICACDVHESKRGLTLRLGADTYINLAAGEKPTGQFDVIIDTAGTGESMEKALPYLAPSGRFIMVGQPPPGKPVCIIAARHMFEGEGKSIHATQGGGFRPDLDIPRYLKLHAAGLLPFSKHLITHRLPLSQVNMGLDLVRKGEAGRVLIEIGKP